MELEELFANRALLKKMSTQDHIQMHVLNRSPNQSVRANLSETEYATSIRNDSLTRPMPQSISHLTKPRSSMCSLNTPGSSFSSLLNKPTSSLSSSFSKPPPSLASLNNSLRSMMIKSDEQTSSSVVYVPEGYGCQMPKGLARFLSMCKITFLILYVFGLPVILYHLHTTLQDTKRRINFLKSSDIDFTKKLWLMKKKYDLEFQEERQPVKDNMQRKEYKENSSPGDEFRKSIAKMEGKIESSLEKTWMIVAVQDWLKGNPDFFNEKCDCTTKTLNCNAPKSSQRRDVEETLDSPQNTKSALTQKELLKVYTRWGRSACFNSPDTTTLYGGIIATTSNLRKSSGAHYLCLPQHQNSSFSKIMSSPHGSAIYGSLIDVRGYKASLLVRDSVPGLYTASCAVCQTLYRNNVVMIPGTYICPQGWNTEYYGYIMAQNAGKKKTSFLCIDNSHEPMFRIIKRNRVLTSFNFVESTCKGLLCSTDGYIKYAEVACVVCAK